MPNANKKEDSTVPSSSTRRQPTVSISSSLPPKSKKSQPSTLGADGDSSRQRVTKKDVGKAGGTTVCCCICDKGISEEPGKGEESIFCEGVCQSWLHTRCAGLSPAVFASVSSSSEPFLCFACHIASQKKEIAGLKSAVSSLTTELSSLKSELSSLQKSVPSSAKITSIISQVSPSSEALSPPPNPPMRSFPSTSVVRHSPERKYNLVVFGIPELKQGSPQHIRRRGDFDRASGIISDVVRNSQSRSSVRDCHRLGKYDHNKPRPRPLLVSLNSTADVDNVLSHRHLVPAGIVVKADLSPEERKVEAILLQERWKLIETGVDRRSIKLRKSSILVSGRIHGRVIDSVYTLSSNLGDLAPALSNLSNGYEGTQSYAAACSSQTPLASSSTTKTDPIPIPHNSSNTSQAQE